MGVSLLAEPNEMKVGLVLLGPVPGYQIRKMTWDIDLRQVNEAQVLITLSDGVGMERPGRGLWMEQGRIYQAESAGPGGWQRGSNSPIFRVRIAASGG